MTTATTPTFTNREQVPVDLNDLLDRDNRYWSRDALEGGWFDYRNEDHYLTLAELVSQRGPLTAAVHEFHEAPGPTPGPLPGVCASCGGTGELHGPGGNGNWLGVACGCQTPFCALCGDSWPCFGAPDDAQAA